jgi:hypothetical protein
LKVKEFPRFLYKVLRLPILLSFVLISLSLATCSTLIINEYPSITEARSDCRLDHGANASDDVVNGCIEDYFTVAGAMASIAFLIGYPFSALILVVSFLLARRGGKKRLPSTPE